MNAEYRRQIAKWTHEALLRKVKAGHAVVGLVFGYDLVRVDGHTERRINEPEAAVVRRIFDLSASGWGYTRIAKQLNADQAIAPRAQQGRPAAWSPSSVYELLHRPLYRGEVVWNKTRKRDARGQTAVAARPEAEWERLERPALRIVSEDLWRATARRLAAARAVYEHAQRRPPRDADSKYLLTGFARCGVCGGGVHVRSHPHGGRRAYFYACTSHYNKGPEVCPHVEQWPMEELDREMLATLTEEVLDPARTDEVVATAHQLIDVNYFCRSH